MRRTVRRKKRNHGRSGEKDLRGNSESRRYRKLWMLKHFGNGKTVKCVHCGKRLDYDTVTADRIIPGCHGGRYGHGNIQPSCKKCNDSRNVFTCGVKSKADAIEDYFGVSLKKNPRRKNHWWSKHRFKSSTRRRAA